MFNKKCSTLFFLECKKKKMSQMLFAFDLTRLLIKTDVLHGTVSFQGS
jgi:hypothetical protein